MGEETFISVGNRWFQTYVTVELGSVNDCYVRQILDDGRIASLEVPTVTYKACEEVG